MKHKHSKLQKFLLLFLIIFGVGASGITGYALVTGTPILSMFSSGIFSSGSGAKTLEQGEMQLESESSTSVTPQEITPTDSTAVSSNSASSIDPDAKINENQLSPQGDTSIAPQPISVTTSQNPTSTSSNSASSKPSSTASKPASPVSSSPESTVSSEPVSSAPDSSSSGHYTAPQISGVTLDKTQLTLNKGDISAVLTPTITPSNASGDKSIKWSTGNANIATVDNIGHITAVGGGTATITATTSNGKTAACIVTVLVPASTIKINSEAFSIDKGASKTLTATVGPEDATDKTVIWATSNNDVVLVDGNGKITAENVGTATITATTGDGKLSAICEVTVGISISTLTLDKTELILIKGTEETLTATVDPPDTTENKTIEWISSKSTVAAVDSNGRITAIEGGTAVITAQVGSHVDECVVTVIVPATGIILDKSALTLPKGTQGDLTATITPEDATDKVVAWTSSDESIATVDSFSGKVTGVKVGKAVITATTHDGSFPASCNVTVVIPTTGITISQRTLNLIKGNNTALTATVLPEEATDQAVIWSTSDPDVVTVDSSGQVTATGGGLATITVKSHDGNFKIECTVTVTVPAAGISLNKTAMKLAKGTSEKLLAQFSPADTTDKGVLWTSSDESVATVDGAGKISAVNVGSTVISAKTHDGGLTASCNVAVVIPVTGIALDKTDLTLSRGSTDLLKATINPSDATDQAVTWLSSNPSVAGIDQNGNITAVAAGHTVISVTAHDGSFVAQCNLTVFVPIQSISLNQTTADLLLGQNTSLTVSINPADTTDDTDVTWTSSNSSVATVDESGKVTAIAVGQANITATVGKFIVSCTVTASDKTVPSAPQNLKASISGSSVIYSFSAPLNNGNTPILGYNVYKNGSKVNTSLMTATSITVPVSGTSTDQIKVKAVNAIGESASLNGTANITQRTEYWTTTVDDYANVAVGGHYESTTHYDPDGTPHGADFYWVTDYEYRKVGSHEVGHSSTYYTVQLV